MLLGPHLSMLHLSMLHLSMLRLNLPMIHGMHMPGAGDGAVVSSLPPAALTVIVLLIKRPAVAVPLPVFPPVGIALQKCTVETGICMIPGQPHRSVPASGPDDIGRPISVIGRPSVFGPEKVVQDAVKEPVPVVIDPGCVRPDPWLRVDIRGRWWVVVALGIGRRRDYGNNACGQKKRRNKNKCNFFHTPPRNFFR